MSYCSRRNLEKTVHFQGPFNTSVKTHEVKPGVIQQMFTVLGQTWIVTSHEDGMWIELDVFEDGKLVKHENIF